MNPNGFPMDAVLVGVGSQNPTKPGPGLCCPNLLHKKVCGTESNKYLSSVVE
jgi:hypothetical protein